MEQDAKIMADCYLACTRTIANCLKMGGEHASPEHINLLMDCANVCLLASDATSRGSDNHTRICKLCADICRQCAEQCVSMANGDETMRQCAEICKKCAEACERMSN